MSSEDFDDIGLSGPENGPSVDSDGDGPGHLASFRAPELETEGGGADDVLPVDQETGERLDLDGGEAVEQISQAAFFEVFKIGFAVPGMMVSDFGPVAVQPEEETQARAASDACYRLLEVYYPKALMPGSDKLADFITAGSFIMGKVMIVRMILQARRVAALEAVNERETDRGEPQGEFRSQRTATAANDNTPPPANVNSPFAWADGEQVA